MNKRQINFNCPLCQGPMTAMDGESLHPGSKEHGVTIWCENKGCSMADWAHGDNEAKAFVIFEMKCGKK